MTLVLRLGARYAGWVVAGVAGTTILLTLIGLALGQRPFTVLTGSMEPAIHAGDVVVVERINPLDARVGTIVTFRDPEGSGRLITHRVRSLRSRGNVVEFHTKGDANNVIERWTVPRDGEIGRVRVRVPAVGHALVLLGGRSARLLLLVLPLLLLAGLEVARIWRPRRSAPVPVPADEPA